VRHTDNGSSCGSNNIEQDQKQITSPKMTKTNSDIGKQNSRGNLISLMEGSLRQHKLKQQKQQQQEA